MSRTPVERGRWTAPGPRERIRGAEARAEGEGTVAQSDVLTQLVPDNHEVARLAVGPRVALRDEVLLGLRHRYLLGLVDGADILIESAEPGRMAALGLGHDVLAARNPALVELRKAEAWDGKLPTNLYASAPIPFLNVK